MTSGLATDLYQITMAAGYWRAGLLEPATFELFVRHLPPHRSYLVAAGLDRALEYLEALRFDHDDREWLRALPQLAHVPAAFFDDYLASFRFDGDVWAIPEGTPVFANEPLLRVTALLPDAQIVETALLSLVSSATSVASKASRIVRASRGRSVVEFGARRGHGLDAAVEAARAAFIGGCDGTSFVEAGRRYGIPISETMAHSWIQSFASEADAFREFSRTFADTAVYLLDTYDTDAAARMLVSSGLEPRTVRIDSGDLGAVSRRVRAILDAGGLTDTRIFATSDLDEDRIDELVSGGAPIDGFGVGTALSTVSDAPALSAVYKLVEVERHGSHVGVVKRSPGKQTWPGPKQVWRVTRGDVAVRDVVSATDEPPVESAAPLLEAVLAGGRRLAPPRPAAELRARSLSLVRALPEAVRRLHGADAYPVEMSETLDWRQLALRERT